MAKCWYILLDLASLRAAPTITKPRPCNKKLFEKIVATDHETLRNF